MVFPLQEDDEEEEIVGICLDMADAQAKSEDLLEPYVVKVEVLEIVTKLD